MKYISLVLILLFSASCFTQEKISNEKKLSKEDAELLEYLFQPATGQRPGANALVIRKGEIIHQKSYGLSNLEEQTPSTPETNYRIASVTKQFTAMAIMILVHQGKINYETSLQEVFPEFPDYGRDITIRHLVTHQSGIEDYYRFVADERTSQMLDREVLDSLMNTTSTYFTPGTQYRYSNTAYAVLAQIVEKISKQRFADFMEEEIFQKLGMTNTCVFELDQPIANRAYGYTEEEGRFVFKDQSMTSAIQGDGGIYCSTLDYYKWDQALYTDALVPKSLLQDAFYNWDNHTRTDETGAGYGWMIDHRNRVKMLHHSGGTSGFETQVIRIPSLELTVVLFTNREWDGRVLWHNANALASIYSNYKFAMPLEIVMKKEIAQKGTEAGIQLYDKLKKDNRFEVKKTTLPYLGMDYLRAKNYKVAAALFDKTKKQYPNYAGGYYSSAVLSKRTGEFDKAIQYYKKVVEMNDEDEPELTDRAQKQLRELQEAKTGSQND